MLAFSTSLFRSWIAHRPGLVTLSPRTRRIRTVTLGFALIGVGAFALTPSVHLDAPQAESTVKDPATDIEFPTTLRIPSRLPLPPYTLLGVGVRKVSFLGIKVYSVGFYADLNSVPPISRSASFEDKIRHVVDSSTCVMRIIPTRSTSYSHLRDGFMRALQARMILLKQRGLFSPEEEARAASPLLKFKSMFPNTPLTKHTPLDVILTPPTAATDKKSDRDERRLIVRDLGSISNDWISKEFMLAYFEDKGISPPLKEAVEERLQDFGN